VKAVIAQGGIARKSPFVMQVTADVLGMPIRVVASDQATALGAAMVAAVAGGVYRNVPEAQKKMGSGFDKTFTPDKARSAQYRKLYQRYTELGRSLEPLLRTL
jgi:L-ribulokinase